MGTVYSISRIGTFEDCRLRYKYQYLDRLRAETETIEAFMGSRVHEALKELYDFVKNAVVKPKDWLLGRYADLWEKNITEDVKVIKPGLTPDDYFRKGKRCLEDYYGEYHPFNQAKVVSLEENIVFPLTSGSEAIDFRGIIDRLDWDDKGKIFEIHDYKTSGTLPTQEEADGDKQLALYQLAVRKQRPEAQNVRLIWHYLLFNKQIESRRTADDLAGLEKEIILKVKEIEACRDPEDFPPHRSALCVWWVLQDICPEWKHPKKMERLESNAYRNDPGVLLVSKYAEIEARKKALKDEIAEIEADEAAIEEAAVEFAKREGINVIDGPNHQLLVSVKEEICAPMKKEDEAKWKALRDLLIREGKYTEVSTVNNSMLNSRLRNWGKDFVEKIKEFLIARITTNVVLKKK